MVRPRIRTTELARLLHSIERPVYVLDGDLTIRFCNEACAAWIGPAAEGLIGVRCTYRSVAGSGDAGSQAVADGLCPPPTVLEGRVVVAPVAVTGPDGVASRRLARFVPIGPSRGAVLAVIALVEPAEVDPVERPAMESLEPAEPAADQFHERIRRFRQEAAGRYGADRLVGDSPAMRLARARIELAAGSRASVLVVGPVGSGRQHVAHAVHYARDLAREGTVFPVDCAVLDADVIRSTVQALAANPLGPRAAQSTLLLAEADLLPAAVQSDVAAAITARSFLLSVVATATTSPERLARKGRYEPQLASLLGTIAIRLPPLARRREDIPLLAQMFVERANAEGPRQLAGFSPAALDRLDAYDWPGNVDELAAVVAEAHARAKSRQIEPEDLPDRLRHAAAAAAHPVRKEEKIRLDEFLGQIERELIARAMARAKGNKTKAASLLGLTRPRLYRRMVQLGLEKE